MTVVLKLKHFLFFFSEFLGFLLYFYILHMKAQAYSPKVTNVMPHAATQIKTKIFVWKNFELINSSYSIICFRPTQQHMNNSFSSPRSPLSFSPVYLLPRLYPSITLDL